MPFTVMTCDNIQGNGHVAQDRRPGLRQPASDPDLAAWIAQHVAFPNSMVDRITPVTTDETRAAACWPTTASRIGGPFAAESFAQWVLEDTFPTGRPPLRASRRPDRRRRRAV